MLHLLPKREGVSRETRLATLDTPLCCPWTGGLVIAQNHRIGQGKMLVVMCLQGLARQHFLNISAQKSDTVIFFLPEK